MIKLLIGGAIGFGIGWVVFKRPQDQLERAVRQTWGAIAQAAQQTQTQAAQTVQSEAQKMQGFGYYRKPN